MNLDLSQICRLCLKLCKDCIDLKNAKEATTVAEKIRFCYFIQIDSSEPLPTKVCRKCIQILTYFYITKKNAAVCDQLLRNIVYIKHRLAVKNVGSTMSEINPPDQALGVEIDNSYRPLDTNTKNLSNNALSITIENNTDRNSSNFVLHSKRKNKKKEKMIKLKLKQKKNRIKNVQINSHSAWKMEFSERKINESESELSNETEIRRRMKHKKVTKVIGTVIDRNNILSPNIKRTRKHCVKK